MKRSSKVDRISYLPIHILSCILSYLPVEEACGTSILSHQWKQIWSSMPVLDLEIDTFSEGVSDEAPSHRSEWGLVHDKDGPILRFQLLESMICCLLDLEQWIGILENMGTLEPDCILCCVTPYELPASLFSLTTLVSLELWRCEVEPPPAFQGFSFLKFLSLECVTVSNEMLESLVSNSKVLESLRVVNCYDLKIIKFDAPSLLSLYLQGEFHDLDVSVNSNLNNLAIYWLSHGVPSIRLQGLVKLESLCFNGWIPDVVMAEDDESRIHSCFLKSISSYFKPKPWLCCLKRLEMKARFIEEIQVAEFFLLNSPALQVLSLHIKLPKKEETKSKLMERWALIPKASPEATFILT